jgi:hypothetical protein
MIIFVMSKKDENIFCQIKSKISVICPEPTVRPPSRIAKSKPR